MRRSSLGILILTLLALPAVAQPQSTPACGKAAFGPASIEGLQGTTYQPLGVEQRLFFGLSGLGDETLEVRYLVKGSLHLTETVNLAAVKPPQIQINRQGGRKLVSESEGALELQSLLEGERMMELLALRPDLVQQLHQLAGEGTPIEVKVFQAGRLVESLSFQELMQRSAELRDSPALPVVVHSAVRGPGDRRGPNPPLFTKDYLPNCGDCTTTTPCDTECGWDPGKGGPVTCGEYGVCVGAGCSCQVSSYSWSSWYLYRTYAASPASYDCLHSRWGGSATHQRYVKEYRRDRIQYSWICPYCPECYGCYSQQQVVSYEYSYSSCWNEVGGGCGFGRRPWCWELCTVYYNTPCN